MAEYRHFLIFLALDDQRSSGTENRSVGGSIPPLGISLIYCVFGGFYSRFQSLDFSVIAARGPIADPFCGAVRNVTGREMHSRIDRDAAAALAQLRNRPAADRRRGPRRAVQRFPVVVHAHHLRRDGCGGPTGRAELLTGMEGASSRPVRLVLVGG